MYKKNYFKSLLLLAMMLVGAGNASAETYTSTVDFESASTAYSDWEFNNLTFPTTVSGITAHGGEKWAETNGNMTAYAKTKNTIANPVSIVFYYTKSSTNTNSSSKFKIQVSSNGESWTDVATGKGMNEVTKGTWKELSADLSNYQNVYVRVYYDGTTAKRDIDDITLTYSSDSTPTCATPTFSPAAGAVYSNTEVSISCSTVGATIYYTTDGTNPTSSSDVYSEPIVITEATTIKAYAVMQDYEDSDVATAEYTIRQPITGYNIDFESDLVDYVDWTFENVGTTNTAITAHGGSKYGANINANGNAVTTASIQTNESVALPGIFTCYVSKTTSNTTTSNWKVQVSEDGTSWTDAASQSATSMPAGSWVEFTTDLSQYSDVYVRLYYTGSNAIRTVDDISLSLRDPNAKTTPTVTVDGSSLITDLAGETNVAAGTATATVTSNNNNVEGATVTWTSSDTGVATIDATTGAVTLIATGTTTLTATFAGNDSYNEASGTYELTVVDSYGPGSENNPFTVAQALAAITSGSFDENTNYYISGIISEIDEVSMDYHNATYFISDDGETSTQLEVFRGKFLDNTNFTSSDQIQIGDEVVIYGKLQYYNNETPEIAQGNYITSLHRKEVKYYLAGSWGENDYGWGEGMEQLTKSGNTYTISKNLDNGTLFKIVKVDETNGNTTTWYGGPADGDWYGVSETVWENLTLSSTGKNFKIDGTCDNAFTFTVDATDADNLTLTVTGWHEPVVKYYLAGNWSENWGDGKVELTVNADGTFSTSKLVGNGSRFKFVKTVDGAETWYGATQSGDDYGINSGWCTDITLSDNGSASAFVIQIASDQELVFKLNATDMTFNVTGWPISLEGNMFVKVTSDEDFTDGAYLIVNEEAGVAFNGGLDENFDAENNIISVTINNNAIVANETTKAALFTIVNNGKITSASGHYIGVSGFSNSLKVDGDATYYNNSVTVTNGNADIAINAGGSNYVHLKYNKASDQNRFRYYKSGQQDIQLYKLVTLPIATITIAAACTDGTDCFGTYSNTQAFVVPEGLTVSEIAVIDGQLLVEDYETGDIVPANTGVMVKAAAGDDYIVTLSTETGTSVLGNDNMLRATGAEGITAEAMGAAEDADCLYYRLTMHNGTQIGFWWGAADGAAFAVAANKAYLAVPTETASKMQGFTFGNDGDATEIVLNALKGEQNGEMYNLQGQKVGSAYKGIVIVNGKKFINK